MLIPYVMIMSHLIVQSKLIKKLEPTILKLLSAQPILSQDQISIKMITKCSMLSKSNGDNLELVIGQVLSSIIEHSEET
jgi:hypothetical protein